MKSILLTHLEGVLSTFTVISDETQKYFAIRVCRGYYRVGHSPLILYYKLLIVLNKGIVQVNGFL